MLDGCLLLLLFLVWLHSVGASLEPSSPDTQALDSVLDNLYLLWSHRGLELLPALGLPRMKCLGSLFLIGSFIKLQGNERSSSLKVSSLGAYFLLRVTHCLYDSPVPIMTPLVCIHPLGKHTSGTFSQETELSFYHPSQTELGESDIHCIFSSPT